VSDAPLVSVLLPTFNGAATLPAVLAAVRAQQAPFAYEVVAVDSGSTDGTSSILEAHGCRVLRIAPGTFNHGLTRNLGIEACRGALIALLVQDAVPQGDAWLQALTAPLRGDPRVAGSYSRQRPRPDASAVTRHYLAGWLACSETARTARLAGPHELLALPPSERYLRCVFDNVSSCVRRSTWERHPFPETPIAEDAEWARDVLLAGHALAYVPEAVVEHSHDRSASYELRRTYLVHQRLHALFGLRTIPTLSHLVRAMASSSLVHLRCLTQSPPLVALRQAPRALALAVAWPLGQYLGARASVTGRSYLKPRGV
jgi:rhamnosyltransferase